jgi:hypothetical protein
MHLLDYTCGGASGQMDGGGVLRLAHCMAGMQASMLRNALVGKGLRHDHRCATKSPVTGLREGGLVDNGT